MFGHFNVITIVKYNIYTLATWAHSPISKNIKFQAKLVQISLFQSTEPVTLPRIFCQLYMDNLSINVMLLLTVFQFFLLIKCPVFLL